MKKKEIKEFAQNVLGCGCPEEVFLSIETRIIGLPEASDLQHVQRILIGNRLLVYLVDIGDYRGCSSLLSVVCSYGVRDRDVNGYNRLRIVLYPGSKCSDDELSWKEAVASYESDRLFVHLLEKKDVEHILIS